MSDGSAEGATSCAPTLEGDRRVIIVTGLSGAGKTTALKALEDVGFEAVDNLPLSLLGRLVGSATAPSKPDAPQGRRPLAVGLDSRTRGFAARDILRRLDALSKAERRNWCLVFLDCDDDGLSRRFSETRRRHPLALDRPVRDGIAREREILEALRYGADWVIDSSGLSGNDLRRRVQSTLAHGNDQNLGLTCMSFGYARGVPRDADLVIDVRFLRNPHYDETLRPLTGRNESVAAYIAADEHFPGFSDRTKELMHFLLPLYQKEGKSYVTIAFGCTGGRHRSVFVSELFGRILDSLGYRVNMVHRDIDRGHDR